MSVSIWRRIGWSLVVVWFVITATFAMISLIPADPAKTMLGPHATPELIARARAYYCLDKGIVAQYGCYVGHLARGDLGESYRTGRSVASILASRLWPTTQLALAAIVLQLLVGIPLGIVAALRKNRWPDRAATFAGLVGQSAPTFFVGTLLLYVFAYRFGWFPIGGYGGLSHLVLPAATLATVGVAYYARVTRSEMIDVLGEDYIRTARAKGLWLKLILSRHAVKNAILPVLTIISLEFAFLLGGLVVTEQVFNLNGLGMLFVEAIARRDYTLTQALVMLVATVFLLVNFVVDIAYAWLDPRIRYR